MYNGQRSSVGVPCRDAPAIQIERRSVPGYVPTQEHGNEPNWEVNARYALSIVCRWQILAPLMLFHHRRLFLDKLLHRWFKVSLFDPRLDFSVLAPTVL